jgi:hypothetical protein
MELKLCDIINTVRIMSLFNETLIRRKQDGKSSKRNGRKNRN